MNQFLIATSGRCATEALCYGLDRFSDHQVRHEPSQLLEEAYLKHLGKEYRSPRLRRKFRELKKASRWSPSRPLKKGYGESWRAPNLLEDVVQHFPGMRVIVIIRNPVDYVLSAYRKGAFRRQPPGDYDRFRLLPEKAEELPLALRIASHWNIVNSYLLEFSKNYEESRTVILQPLETITPLIADFLGITIRDYKDFIFFLTRRPNSSPNYDIPEGFDQSLISEFTRDVWEMAKISSEESLSA